MATLIQEERKRNPKLLLIDGGDFFNSYPFPLLNRAVAQVYRLIKPDILTPGDQEFMEGIPFFKKNIKPLQKQLLATNLFLPDFAMPKEKVYTILKRTKIAFLSYLDPQAFQFSGKSSAIHLRLTDFNQLYHALLPHTFIVVIYHGPQAALKRFLARHQKIDCVLLGHTQSSVQQLKNKPYIIGGGEDGENLLDIRIKEQSGIFKVQVNRLPVYESLKQNEKIASIIRLFNAKNLKARKKAEEKN